jgi:hypothetical protein
VGLALVPVTSDSRILSVIVASCSIMSRYFSSCDATTICFCLSFFVASVGCSGCVSSTSCGSSNHCVSFRLRLVCCLCNFISEWCVLFRRHSCCSITQGQTEKQRFVTTFLLANKSFLLANKSFLLANKTPTREFGCKGKFSIYRQFIFLLFFQTWLLKGAAII